MKIGKFIIFEGNEGSGKSTQIEAASRYLSSRKIENIITREPGGTPLGENIRDILLNKNSKLNPLSESLLFYSSRIINYQQNILKALKQNKYVLCDRFHYSTLVYQGLCESNELVQNLHKVLDPYFSEKISVIFYLDTDIETCHERLKKRKLLDKFESQGKEYLIKIKYAYEKIFRNNEKVITINTSQDQDKTEEEIKKYLNKLIDEN